MLSGVLAPALLRAEDASSPATGPGGYGFATVRAEADNPGIPC